MKRTKKRHKNFKLSPADNKRLANLCGQFDEHLRQVEKHFDVKISNRGHHFEVKGHPEKVKQAGYAISSLYEETTRASDLTPDKVQLQLQETKNFHKEKAKKLDNIEIHTRHGTVKARSPNQQKFLNNIANHPVNFGIGPAGTGKTYLAVACAAVALESQLVDRIILVRPAVEAGEHLGFLPGDYTQKLDPYFEPLYDALFEILGTERTAKLIDQRIIEIAPLAYMRGRTLNHAFIILDEAQNTTPEQMKMFLTRIGFGSIAVITGDITQTDLPKNIPSGLRHAIEILKEVDGVSFSHFQSKDAIRHPIVQSILNAYESRDGTSQKK